MAKLQVAAVIPEADSNTAAVVTRETVGDVLQTATETIDFTTEELYKSDDEEGNLVTKTKRTAKLKTQTPKATKAQQVDFVQSLQDVKIVDFELFQEGPPRELRSIYPLDTDLDSPYALVLLFWTDEMFKTLATNTNAYAVHQRAVVRDLDSTGVRSYGDNFLSQRPWFSTNANELRVFVGILIYIGLHPEGLTATYWHQNILTGPNYTPALYMSYKRFTQLQRFLHIAPYAWHGQGGPEET